MDICKVAYERYSGGDFDGLLELFHPEVEVYVAPPNFESGTYEGHQQYRDLIDRWGAPWEEMRITTGRMEAAGEWILAEVRYTGRGKASEVEVTQPSWELSLWRDGLCTRYEVYWDERQGERAFEKHTGYRGGLAS
jgi:ketosteroid isomerase-like protein